MSDFLRLSPEITGQDQGRTSHSKADADELQIHQVLFGDIAFPETSAPSFHLHCSQDNRKCYGCHGNVEHQDPSESGIFNLRLRTAPFFPLGQVNVMAREVVINFSLNAGIGAERRVPDMSELEIFG